MSVDNQTQTLPGEGTNIQDGTGGVVPAPVDPSPPDPIVNPVPEPVPVPDPNPDDDWPDISVTKDEAKLLAPLLQGRLDPDTLDGILRGLFTPEGVAKYIDWAVTRNPSVSKAVMNSLSDEQKVAILTDLGLVKNDAPPAFDPETGIALPASIAAMDVNDPQRSQYITGMLFAQQQQELQGQRAVEQHLRTPVFTAIQEAVKDVPENMKDFYIAGIGGLLDQNAKITEMVDEITSRLKAEARGRDFRNPSTNLQVNTNRLISVIKQEITKISTGVKSGLVANAATTKAQVDAANLAASKVSSAARTPLSGAPPPATTPNEGALTAEQRVARYLQSIPTR